MLGMNNDDQDCLDIFCGKPSEQWSQTLGWHFPLYCFLFQCGFGSLVHGSPYNPLWKAGVVKSPYIIYRNQPKGLYHCWSVPSLTQELSPPEAACPQVATVPSWNATGHSLCEWKAYGVLLGWLVGCLVGWLVNWLVVVGVVSLVVLVSLARLVLLGWSHTYSVTHFKF